MSINNQENMNPENTKPEEKPEEIICPRCEDVLPSERANSRRSVITQNTQPRTQLWCPSCVASHSFYCDYESERYDDENYTARETEDTNVTFCLEISGSDFYCSEVDDNWYQHSDNLPENQDDDNDGRGEHVHEYHCGPRPWTGKVFGPHHLGIELEVEVDDRAVLAEWITGNAPGFICETDGSLSSRTGLEIIAPPLGPESLEEPWFKVLRKLRAFYAETPSNAGMHINMDRSALGGSETLNNIFTLINRYHRWFKRFTGRASTYGQYEPRYRWGGGSPECHCAVSAQKRNRVEWRIFCSTTDDIDWKASVETVRAARLFCTEAPVELFRRDTMTAMAIEWRKWLRRNAGNYPAILARARKQGMCHPEKALFTPVHPGAPQINPN